MEISPIGQAYLLLYCALFGVCLGAFYDVFVVIRRLCADKKALSGIARFVGDLLLLVTAGVGTVLLCYYFNKGEVRFFAFLGLAVGFFLWRAVPSRAFVPALSVLFRLLFAVLRRIFRPLAKIFKYLVNILQKSIYYIKKSLAKIMIMVYNINVKRTVLRRSKDGFIGEHKK